MQDVPHSSESNNLASRRYKLLFGVRRSVRYHSYRRQHYIATQSFISLLILILGSGSVLNLFVETIKADWFQPIAPVAITVLASISLVYGPTAKASLHYDLYRRFIRLEREFVRAELDARELDRLEDKRLEIEMDEPATYQALNRLCHNELLKSEGRYDLLESLKIHHLLLKGFWRFDNLPRSQRHAIES